MPTKKGERNWEDVAEDYELHLPTAATPSDDLEHIIRRESGIIWVHGTPYIRAADGKLDPIDY